MRARTAAALWLAGAATLGAALPGAHAQDEPADERSYEVRLRELEQRVEELRQRVWAHPSRIDPATSTLVVEIDERLGPGLRVAGAEMSVHGRSHALSWERVADGTQRLRARIPAAAGAAELTVRVAVAGDGGDLFPYLDGYRTTIEASRSVRLPPLGEQAVQIVVWEGGSPTATFCERPRIGFRVAVP